LTFAGNILTNDMILRIIFAAILMYLLYRICRRLFLPSGKKVKPLPNDRGEGGQGEELVEDPVCHTYLPISQAHEFTDHGRTHYFCSEKCLEQFRGRERPKQEGS
jgi:YHS domain-containing protein